MPQLDISFYFSQFFWMTLCLCALVFAFKKIFIPRMNDIISRRDEYVSKYEKQTEAINGNIASVENEINSINSYKNRKVDEVIKGAIRKADETEGNQLKAIKDENEALINGTRSRLIEEMKNIGVNSRADIDAMAHDMFNKLFTGTLPNEHI